MHQDRNKKYKIKSKQTKKPTNKPLAMGISH